VVFANPIRSVVPSSVHQAVVTVWDTTPDGFRSKEYFPVPGLAVCPKRTGYVEAKSAAGHHRQVRAKGGQQQTSQPGKGDCAYPEDEDLGTIGRIRGLGGSAPKAGQLHTVAL